MIMSKAYRQQIDKYAHTAWNTSYQAAAVIRALCPELTKLLDWLEAHIGENEHIDVHHWQKQLFYIAIEDCRFVQDTHYSTGARLFFTVDVKRDVINWNTDCTVNMHGGNCGLRSAKWNILARSRFIENFETGFHHYKVVHPTKSKS